MIFSKRVHNKRRNRITVSTGTRTASTGGHMVSTSTHMQFLQLHSSPEQACVGRRNTSEFSHVIAEGLSGQSWWGDMESVRGMGGVRGCWPRLQRGKYLPVLLVGGSGIQDPQPSDYLLSALFRVCVGGYLGMETGDPHLHQATPSPRILQAVLSCLQQAVSPHCCHFLGGV